MTFSTKKAKKAAKAAEKAARQAAEKAADQGSNFLDDASNVVGDVIDYIAPRAQQAKDKIVDAVAPAVDDVRDRVQPAVKNAYENVSDKVSNDFYPQFQNLLDQAGDNPQVRKIAKRSKKQLKKLRKQMNLPTPAKEKKSVLRRLFTILGIAAVIGIAVAALKVLLGSADDGWSPQEPMRPAREDGESGWPEAPATRSADDEDAESSEDADESEYGEGAYVGSEPPEGYSIKGNERSMKYHVPEAAGYDRTNADVWFNSEQAAQNAGFTRAQR